jgi:hypothetical protein
LVDAAAEAIGSGIRVGGGGGFTWSEAATAAPPLEAVLNTSVERFMSSRLALSAATAPPRFAVLFIRSTSDRRREASPERKMLPPVIAPFHLMRLQRRKGVCDACT